MSDRLAGRASARRLSVIRRWSCDYVLDTARDPECVNLRLLAEEGYAINSWRLVACVERFFTHAESKTRG